VFSNATLQWLPGHATLFPHLLAQVAEGGALAVQMPSTAHGLFRQLVMAAADASPHAAALQPAKTATRTELPSTYYDLLQPLCAEMALWETEYGHVLADHGAIIEWIKGTALQPYLKALPDATAQAGFLTDLLQRVESNFPAHRDGTVLFPFRRTFVIAYRR
jgi:trans-aconitate 2-methyltransferase